MKRGDLLMGILTWLFGGHKEATASTAATAQSTTVEAPKKKTKKITATKKTTSKTSAKKGRGRPKKK